jgi:uncharacterized membrane protein
MNVQFTHPAWLWLLVPTVAWIVWLAWRSDVQTAQWRRWTALALRLIIAGFVIFAVAGFRWMHPLEGMNVIFLLDRSDSIPSQQQEAARMFVNEAANAKNASDNAGVIVFGTEAGIEFYPRAAVDLQKVQAVVGTERTDIARAIRLGTAALPEHGQKRLVLLSDGNENSSDALAAILAARPLGVTLDVVPLGVSRGQDVSVQRLAVPSSVKQGQTFEAKIFAQADEAQTALVRLYRNDQLLGEQPVELAAGKNLFTFPQTLAEPGFYSYSVHLEAPGDLLPQNNRATGYTHVRGEPRVLVVSENPDADAPLVGALQSARIEARGTGLAGFPGTLAEMQSYDAIFLSNIAAGDLGEDLMKLIGSAVRDFGVGLVCVGGEQTFAAGGYRGTPLETALPVEMELSSKKVLPSGAIVLVVHATEFPNGNQWARDTAFATLEALGPQDEMGVVFWDGRDRWLFPLAKVGDRQEMGRLIAGMNPGDMPSFQNVMTMAHKALKGSTANLKHMIVFSDGDPAAPTPALMQSIVDDRITLSTVMIGGHVLPDPMMAMASTGGGRFYDVRSPDELPQIFVKEAAVILKSAIYEEPFKPQLAGGSELVRGIGADEYPTLFGYVATTGKPRAEIPLLTDKGDPLLAHWQFGLGRAAAFTSDAKAKWGAQWLTWEKYQQFWSQVAQWSLRRLENAEFTAEVLIDKGEGHIRVEALDEEGNYRNFLQLQTVVVGPRGERQMLRLEQTGPGHYEARFPTREVGGYQINLLEFQEGQVRAAQVLGASLDYSPEFSSPDPNHHLLRRLAESGGGKILDPRLENPFQLRREKTFQPEELWPLLLKLAIILFVLDVAVRRVQIDREEWLKATQTFRRWLLFWKPVPRPAQADESLAALLTRREQIRSTQTAPAPDPGLFRPKETPNLQPGTPGSARTTVQPQHPAMKPTSSHPAEPTSTTDRLLEAKRRARKKL